MKRKIQSIGYLAFMGIGTWLLIKAISSYKNPFSLYENPLVWGLLIAMALLLVVKEYFNYTVSNLAQELKDEKEGIVAEKADEWAWFKNLMKKFTKSKSLEDSGKIELDHNYDGIKELDNVLPPWWVYLFYATILFGAVYLVRFEVMDGDTQFQEYEKTMAQAQRDIEKYKASTPNVFDIEKVEQLKDDGSLGRGKAIFGLNCASCHAIDGGGGIGPNLTDKHWILGGGFKNAFNTIYNGGRDGKGMVAWKATLKPQDIQKVASYVLSLQGTTPAKPKAPQGDVWVDKAQEVDKADETTETAQ